MSPKVHIFNHMSQEHQNYARNKFNINLEPRQMRNEDPAIKIYIFNQRSQKHPLCLKKSRFQPHGSRVSETSKKKIQYKF